MNFEGSALIFTRFFVFTMAVVFSIFYAHSQKHTIKWVGRVVVNVFTLYALGWILFTIFLWFNHINFPLELEAMELTVLQHLRRIMLGQPIYIAPSPDFVPLAYAPLYYYLSVPFVWLFGATLFTMRFVAILGMLGSEIVIFLAVKKKTNSYWWGTIALGLFVAAYRVMETYLDNAHSDSWLLFSVLLGCYLLEQNRSRSTNILGVFFLILSFWFKQHGALFAIGGVLYLTWRDGLKNSWIYWLIAGLFGPVLYAVAPTLLLGPQFHYYTFTIPSRWSELNLSAVKRYVGFAIKNYIVLAGIGTFASIHFLTKELNKVSIWFFMLPFAMLSGFMGALDPGSMNNVFILMGVWFIITGVFGLHALVERYHVVENWGLYLVVIGSSFALFFYRPQSVIVSPKASEAYNDMIEYLNVLDGPVYAPFIGQLEDGYTLSPSVHWVPMEDLIRGPGVDTYNHPNTRMLLDSVIHPKGTGYILTNIPLENDSLLSFLLNYYSLETDLGVRFASLAPPEKRFNLKYPRYLYKYHP